MFLHRFLSSTNGYRLCAEASVHKLATRRLHLITGILLFQPTQFSLPVKLLGGFGMIRIYHFAAMIGFLSFIPGHLLMVVLHGWSNFYSMLTGWKRDPDYLAKD